MENRSRWITAVLICLALAAAAAPAQGPSLAGRWNGEIQLPTAPLGVEVDLQQTESGWTGDISIPAQGARDLALADVRVSGSEISFRIAGIPGDPTFQGRAGDDGQTISGDFTQGPGKFPFLLTRGADAARQAELALQGLDPFLEQSLEQWKAVGLALAIVVDGQVVHARGYGYRDLEQQLPVTADTLFAIGSATKAFTTFTLATLVDQGQLDWDRPVVEYLPGWQLYDEVLTARVTPRDMVTHRTGLPRHDLVWYNNQGLARSELFGRLRFLAPNEDLRETFQYNNLMYAMAGYLTERLTGTTWEEAVRARVLTPLGMTRSNFSVLDSQADPDHALPYQVHDEEVEKMAFRVIDNMAPAGSINSSVNEMSRWLRVLLAGGTVEGVRVLSKEALTELHTPQMAIRSLPRDQEISPGAYGMGWFLNSYRGHYRVQHGGNIDGFSALVTYFPNDGVGIVALANQNGSALPGLATNHAADRIFGLEPKDWNAEALRRRDAALAAQKEADEKKTSVKVPDTSPPHPLESYAGRYSHPGYGELLIDLESDGSLAMEYNGIRTPLEHWHYDVFNGLENPDDRTFEDFKLQFETNLKGQVAAVSAPFAPEVDPIRFLRQADPKLFDPVYLSRFEGEYVLGPQTITIRLRGNTLTMSLPGQPVYELVPAPGEEFDLEGLNGFSVRFQQEEGQWVAIVKQPNGVFTARRK